MQQIPESRLKSVLGDVLAAAKTRNYAGHNKHDGLLSPVLWPLRRGKWPRLAAIQLVTRSPVNIRPLFLIPKTRNPKGIGLFAHSLLRRYEMRGEAEDLPEARNLLQWLLAHTASGFEGISWGYQYPWQDAGFFAPSNFFNRVVTCWIGFSFYEAWRITKETEYLKTCKEICRFLLHSPRRIVDTAEELCLSYVPDTTVDWAVMDVSALAGKMLALTGTACGDSQMLAEARRCMNYVAKRQTGYGAWFYTDPPGDSHITHDNYHTGIILDCFLDYMAATGDHTFMDRYRKGLNYYAENLFLSNGAPKWMNHRIYPHDIHGAAQGIITFSKASVVDSKWTETADRILAWTLENLYDEQKHEFWYQKTRWYTKRFSLMRWCNAWMSYALATRLGLEKKKGQS